MSRRVSCSSSSRCSHTSMVALFRSAIIPAWMSGRRYWFPAT